MVRLVLLFSLSMGLLGVPVLCTAGSLLHACECGEAIGCGHEEDCADDPCLGILALRTSADVGDLLPATVPAPRLIPLAGREGESPIEEAPPLENLPYPAGQRPLLI